MRKLETAISDDVLQLQRWRARAIDSRNQLDTRSRNFDSIRRAKLAANLRVVRNLNVRVMALPLPAPEQPGCHLSHVVICQSYDAPAGVWQG